MQRNGLLFSPHTMVAVMVHVIEDEKKTCLEHRTHDKKYNLQAIIFFVMTSPLLNNEALATIPLVALVDIVPRP